MGKVKRPSIKPEVYELLDEELEKMEGVRPEFLTFEQKVKTVLDELAKKGTLTPQTQNGPRGGNGQPLNRQG